MKNAVVYGTPNCDTIKKTIVWLKENKIPFEFYDYKKMGITSSKLKEWMAVVPWEQLINKKGTTWKKLDPAAQQSTTNQKAALKLLQENTSMIKRPVTELNGKILVGFDELIAATEKKKKSA